MPTGLCIVFPKLFNHAHRDMTFGNHAWVTIEGYDFREAALVS